MHLEIRIEMDNAAFDVMPERELQALLADVGIAIADGQKGGKIQDINGNTCGHFEIKEEAEPSLRR